MKVTALYLNAHRQEQASLVCPAFFAVEMAMPWKIEPQDGKFCVIKESDGSVEKCHDTKMEAGEHMKALYANETKELIKVKGVSMPLTFADLDKLREAQKMAHETHEAMYDFQMLADNVLYSDEVGDKAGAIRALAGEMEARMAKKPMEMEHKAVEPSWLASFKDQVVLAVKSLLSKPGDAPEMMIFKESDGSFQVVTRYSNKFRDDDHPSEIIASASHRKFSQLVEAGIVPAPELWLWHVPEWKIGDGLWAAYDDSGFALAGHRIPAENAGVVEALKQASDVRVSHGMPIWSIRRSPDDPSVIEEHVTKEVSLLPGWAAANKLTSAVILEPKENDIMALSKEQKEKLIGEWGISRNLIDQLEAQNKNVATLADTAGVESKETTETTPPAAPETQPVPAAEVAQPDSGLAEVTKALTETMAAVIAVSQKVDGLASIVKELKASDEAKVAEKAANTPLASLSELLRKSVVESPDTVVDGRTSLAKSGPPQAQAEQPRITGIPFIDGFIGNGVPRKEGGN